MRLVASIVAALSIPLFFCAGLAQDLAKAKQEGRVVFYTSWGPSDADYVVKAFEKKYAPLKVETVRASSERTLTRLLSEHRANKFLGDVAAISGIQSGILKEKGSLDRYQSPEATIFPVDWRDPDGFGMGLHQTIYVIGYNTKLVSADAVPKNYEDLLHPRWKGQLGWDTEEYYLLTLNPIDGDLCAFVEILHAHGEPIESELGQCADLIVTRDRRVNFPWRCRSTSIGSMNTPRKARRCSGSRRTRSWAAILTKSRSSKTRRAPTRRNCLSTSCFQPKVRNCSRTKAEVRDESALAQGILSSRERRLLPCM